MSKEQSFSTFAWQGVARIGWLPVYSENSNTILHIAVNGRYGKPEDNKIRVRSRPQVSPAPYFVDTEVFPADYSLHVGGELYYRSGSWMIGTEYYAHKFNSSVTGSPLFYGGEIMASYIITGEVRPYRTMGGVFGFVPLKKPVFKGGPGAWEAVLQFSNIDLNSGTLTGGKFWARAVADEIGLAMTRAITVGAAATFVAGIRELIADHIAGRPPRSLGARGPRPFPCAPGCCAYAPPTRPSA